MIGSPRVYYAHHLWKYNTEIEKFEIDIIKNKLSGYTVVNPNGAVPQDGNISEAAAMDRCFKLINDCSALVFSTYSEVVGRGCIKKSTMRRIVGNLSIQLAETRFISATM